MSSTDKFNRNYRLTIQIDDDGDTIVIQPPFTLEFDITRNTLTSANICQIRIYNLSTVHRNWIRYNEDNYGQFRSIQLEAGYGNSLTTIFSGNISWAFSVREGVNFISQIECFDGGFAFANGVTATSFPKNTLYTDVFKGLIRDLPFTSQGIIGAYPGRTTRGSTYNGNTTGIIRELSGGGFYIDKGNANILGTNEYIIGSSPILAINADTGLLGTPQLERTLLRFDMIFEPALDIGSVINLDSDTDQAVNGLWKVTGVKHRGMISESVCGTLITTGEFYYSKFLEGVSANE